MITISIDPIILNVGHLALRWYSLMLLTAIAVGTWLTAREAQARGFRKDDVYDAALWILAGGLAGARLLHVLDHWQHEYAADPVRALFVWEGGLAIWGAVIGGIAAAAVVARQRRWNLARLLDAGAPGLVLAQAIGRIACVITGDAMGKPTQGPLGFAYTSPNAMVPQLGVYYTPMPVYELIANVGIFLLLWKLRKRPWEDGQLFLVYVAAYSVERFLLAYTSSYQVLAAGLTQSQVVALAALTVSLLFLLGMAGQRRQPVR